MKTVARYFNLICRRKYQPLGFSKNKSTYIRVQEDTLQTFTLRCSREIPNCSVEFGIFPLCMPQPIFLDAGGYLLDDFWGERPENLSGWTFDSNSDESLLSCAESVSGAIDLYLLPFLEKCKNCESSLLELVRLEELLDHNRQMKLRLSGDIDSAVHWRERSLFDSRKFYMALKSSNVAYAQQYLMHQINFCETKLKSLDNPNSPKQPDVVKERLEDKLALCFEYLGWIESGDYNYFDNLLKANEIQMVKYLSDRYPSICIK